MGKRVTKLKQEYIAIFRQMCKDLGLTQTDLARKINVSPKSVSAWFRGTTTPNLDNIRKIADFFNTKILF